MRNEFSALEALVYMLQHPGVALEDIGPNDYKYKFQDGFVWFCMGREDQWNRLMLTGSALSQEHTRFRKATDIVVKMSREDYEKIRNEISVTEV